MAERGIGVTGDPGGRGVATVDGVAPGRLIVRPSAAVPDRATALARAHEFFTLALAVEPGFTEARIHRGRVAGLRGRLKESAGAAPAPQFRSDVESVRVDVLVSDRGRPARGLTKDDFEIRDNGVPQRIDRVSFEEMPLNLVPVLDTSGSLGDRRLAVLGEAAGVLLEDLGKDARAALVTFNHVVAQRIGLTSDLPAVRRAISGLTGGGLTALNDGVYAGMMLAQADADRAIVVVLSDGVDIMSWLTSDAVLDTARRSDVVVYSVYTGGPRAPALLRDLASVTGGAIFQNVAAERLQQTFAGIAGEFRPAAPFGRSSLAAFAFTPDGRSIVFAGAEGAGRRLYRRVLDQTEAAAIAGTEGGAAPFISPDGGWIGFWAGGALKKVPVGGGAAETLHDLRATASADAVAMGWSNELGSVTDLFYGAAWLADDRIVYGRFAGGLWAIPSSGGAPRRLTDTREGELAHRMPRALPGGGAIFFTVQASLLGELTAIDALVLDTGERRRLVEGGSDARYAAGHLLFAREGALYAVGFDPASLAVRGEPFRVLPDVMHAVHGNSPGVSSGAAQFDLSADGMLAFLPGGPLWASTLDLGWVERGGRIERLDVRPMSYLAPKVSPDGRRLAVAGKSGTEAANAVYTIDLARGIPTMIARDAVFPLWAPDGTRLIAALRQAGRQEIYAIPLAEAGEPSRIAGSRFPLFPGSISADGRWLAYVESNPATGNDIWVVGLDPTAEPRPVVRTPANEGYPAFSPDGAWLAYSSTEGGAAEVYVQSFPGPGRREQVSSGGGISPVWAPDGRSIYYLDPARGRALVVPVTPGTPLQFGQPAVFAEGAFPRATPVGALDIARDGRRLLVTLPGTDPGPPHGPHEGQLHVIVNWAASFTR